MNWRRENYCISFSHTTDNEREVLSSFLVWNIYCQLSLMRLRPNQMHFCRHYHVKSLEEILFVCTWSSNSFLLLTEDKDKHKCLQVGHFLGVARLHDRFVKRGKLIDMKPLRFWGIVSTRGDEVIEYLTVLEK